MDRIYSEDKPGLSYGLVSNLGLTGTGDGLFLDIDLIAITNEQKLINHYPNIPIIFLHSSLDYIMDWIALQHLPPHHRQITFLQNLDKFTLHDHNYIATIDQEEQTFTCVFNCKKSTKAWESLGKIHGDLKGRFIEISGAVVESGKMIGGRWQYQKVELSRFASRYNEISYKNITIKINPFSGQLGTSLHFLAPPSLFQDSPKFKESMTDFCQLLGEQTEMIFHTMMEIIFCKQACEPYLKSGMKINPSFPRYMKIEKLLDKIKSLIVTSNHYKIRADISTAHKQRSYFKKVFLQEQKHKKIPTDPKILQLALAYEPKFNRKYEETENKSRIDRNAQYIKEYIELEEKNETSFAQHLNAAEMLEKDQIARLVTEIRGDGEADGNARIISTQKGFFRVVVQECTADQLQFQVQILKKIQILHVNLLQYVYCPTVAIRLLHMPQPMVPLSEYLQKNRRTISLSTRFHLMAQICDAFVYLRKKNLALFIDLQTVWVSRGLTIKIGGYGKAYVKDWLKDQAQRGKSQCRAPFRAFPHIFYEQDTLSSEKCDVFSLGCLLYYILLDKYPFHIPSLAEQAEGFDRTEWRDLWVVQTQFFVKQGGQLVKLVAHLLLKCMDLQYIDNRPYIEWIAVILWEIKTSLNGLY